MTRMSEKERLEAAVERYEVLKHVLRDPMRKRNHGREDTLNEIIDYCKAKSKEEQDYARTVLNDIAKGWAIAESHAYDRIADHCRSMLGYSGHMPSEVPNQSEDAK